MTNLELDKTLHSTNVKKNLIYFAGEMSISKNCKNVYVKS